MDRSRLAQELPESRIDEFGLLAIVTPGRRPPDYPRSLFDFVSEGSTARIGKSILLMQDKFFTGVFREFASDFPGPYGKVVFMPFRRPAIVGRR